VSGWGSVNENVEGPPIYDVLENYIIDKQEIKPEKPSPVRVIGM
jgi:sulfur-oxidizing protein SoxB